MELNSIIITLSVIKVFTIKSIPILMALKQLIIRIDRFVMAMKVWTSVGAEFTVILMSFTL